MNKYKNKKTGAILETPCKVSGGDWEEIKKNPKKSDKKKDNEPPEENGKDTEAEEFEDE